MGDVEVLREKGKGGREGKGLGFISGWRSF